jgi:membrane complex biogenesis BtpA family protein
VITGLPTRRDGRRPFAGVVHLLPLPGGPAPSPGLDAVLARARDDARTLAAGGADALVVENLGDAPFTGGEVEPFTVAAMALAVAAVRQEAPSLPVGVNVLRNDARAAIAIAAATRAAFVRINVHIGAMVTDQGLIEGRARDTLLDRNRLAPGLALMCDVHVKHAAPLGEQSLTVSARDTWHRGRADALVVSGTGTGQPTDPDRLAAVCDAVPEAPVWLGSGVVPDNAHRFDRAAGAVVGTYLHHDGDLTAPIDVQRVRALREAWR